MNRLLLGAVTGALLLTSVSPAHAADPVPQARGTAFHTEVHPPHWMPWTTDGAPAITSGPAFLTHGLRCGGRYCDDVSLLNVESGFTHTNSWWTDGFSEEGNNERVCANNGFVTGLSCASDYCDTIALRCSQLNNGGVRASCYWSEAVSDESGGTFVAPESMFLAGIRCSGRYCDNKQLYLCQANAGGPTLDVNAMARQFAPRLRFDQEFSTGSGEQSKCFPSDPGTYYTQRAQGVSAVSLCNKDYGLIRDNRVPTYYVAQQIGTNTVMLRYWYFYAWQSTCFASAGAHAADWESMAALIVDGKLSRVAYYQHGGWYSKEAGTFELADGTHPVGYVGKNAHGTYHDNGGTGGCLYFEDYRNPGGNDYRMDTWNNLVPLARGSGAPAWVNCTGSGCFDGIGHPLEQTGDLRAMRGCGKDGCGKSSVGELIPFQTDPTGADHTGLFAQHSGKVIEVPGASTSDGTKLTQSTNRGTSHQRWLLEATGDGYFTLRARHSGKCMDVAGSSTAGGMNVSQYTCNAKDNQRYRLTPGANGVFTLQAKHSGQCLDVAGATQDDGGFLVQWPCAGTTNENFRFAR
ncbi:RICIN domain-containing protein [Melittangium boletus]|uniref:RICIN domain-containing protein n=1 Tax=Melittangium boletus TaxID=83453 RepID=UPI003DA4EFD8